MTRRPLLFLIPALAGCLLSTGPSASCGVGAESDETEYSSGVSAPSSPPSQSTPRKDAEQPHITY